MSTVLEKPVLLDETGQEIVDKLDEIKSAISSGGEYIPLAIRVTTPPTKTSYYAGDALDLSGIVVSLVGSNGSLIDVTAACTFSPANGSALNTSDTNISITYHYEKDNVDFTASQVITVNAVVATSIAVTTPPTKTNYLIGETLDLTGIHVTATFNNGTTEDVTAACTFSPANGTTLSNDSINTISITYLTLSTSQSISVSYPIYGAEWDGTASTIWARTDAAADFVDPIAQMSDGIGGWTSGSSPFDNISPWSEMVRIEDPAGGTLVKIPKFYYKWTRNGSKLKLQISPTAIDGFYTSPAHADREDGQGERDYVYIGAYRCAQSTYKSTTGVAPASNQARDSFRTSIHTLGNEYYQSDFALFWTIRMLYLVEFANWNSQDCIGMGCSTFATSFSIINNGITDSMPYHTGTTGSTRSQGGYTKYRNIENLYSNGLEFIDGIYCPATSTKTTNEVWAINNPNQYGEPSFGGTGVLLGTKVSTPNENNVVTTWTEPSQPGYEYALIGATTESSTQDDVYDTYSCDNYYVSTNISSAKVFLTGGITILKAYGLFYIELATNARETYKLARLQKLPANI